MLFLAVITLTHGAWVLKLETFSVLGSWGQDWQGHNIDKISKYFLDFVVNSHCPEGLPYCSHVALATPESPDLPQKTAPKELMLDSAMNLPILLLPYIRCLFLLYKCRSLVGTIMWHSWEEVGSSAQKIHIQLIQQGYGEREQRWGCLGWGWRWGSSQLTFLSTGLISTCL